MDSNVYLSNESNILSGPWKVPHDASNMNGGSVMRIVSIEKFKLKICRSLSERVVNRVEKWSEMGELGWELNLVAGWKVLNCR